MQHSYVRQRHPSHCIGRLQLESGRPEREASGSPIALRCAAAAAEEPAAAKCHGLTARVMGMSNWILIPFVLRSASHPLLFHSQVMEKRRGEKRTEGESCSALPLLSQCQSHDVRAPRDPFVLMHATEARTHTFGLYCTAQVLCMPLSAPSPSNASSDAESSRTNERNGESQREERIEASGYCCCIHVICCTGIESLTMDTYITSLVCV